MCKVNITKAGQVFFFLTVFFFKLFLEINVDGQPKQTHRFM